MPNFCPFEVLSAPLLVKGGVLNTATANTPDFKYVYISDVPIFGVNIRFRVLRSATGVGQFAHVLLWLSQPPPPPSDAGQVQNRLPGSPQLWQSPSLDPPRRSFLARQSSYLRPSFSVRKQAGFLPGPGLDTHPFTPAMERWVLKCTWSSIRSTLQRPALQIGL